MKKFCMIALILVLTMCLFAGCRRNNVTETTTPSTAAPTRATTAPTTVPPTTAAPTQPSTAATAPSTAMTVPDMDGTDSTGVTGNEGIIGDKDNGIIDGTDTAKSRGRGRMG